MSAVIDKYYSEEIQEVRKEAHAEGEARLAALISAMAKNGDAANVQKAADDPAFREEMYKKYKL